jgi:hypothetical protein
MTVGGLPNMTDAPAEAPVFRRHVFYIPGYDPIPPRRYRELYRTEAAAQAKLSGYDIALRPRSGDGPYGWMVTAQIEGKVAEANFDVLVWSDIVRRSMGVGIASTYLQLFQTAWAYVGSGVLFRLMRLRKGPIIAALYPIVGLFIQAVLALGFACLIGVAISTLSPGAFGAALAFLASVAALAIILRWFRDHDGRFYVHYLMHDFAFSARENGAYPSELETRLTQFRGLIAVALASDVDEVLVVGHSSGAHLAVSILADMIRPGLPAQRPALSFLSLGQVVPMVSFLPKAQRLRNDLHFLSARKELTWVDVTAPGDGCSFALCDPVAVSGVAPADQLWPLILSAAFSQTLTAERWRELRWRFFRLHFQYLCAFDNLAGRKDDYDYFRITAGPMTLAARFSTRQPSQSRITHAVNRNIDLVA